MSILVEKVTILFECGMNRDEISRELLLTLDEVDCILDLYEQKLTDLRNEIEARNYC